MNSKWFYLHDGQAHGPFSTAEIRDMAARGEIQELDLVWQEGASADDRIPANAALDFSTSISASSGEAPPTAGPSNPTRPVPAPALPASPTPDWLSDISAQERTGPLPGPIPTTVAPNWLEDLRLWVGLDLFAPMTETSLETTAESPPLESVSRQSQGLPDWLEGWSLPEKPAAPPLEPPKVASPAPAKVEGTVAEAHKRSPPAPAPAKMAIPIAMPYSPPPGQVPTKTTVPGPIPTAPSKPAAPPPKTSSPARAIEAADTVAEKTLLETGFDPRTGRILDPNQFHKWKQQKAKSAGANQPGLTNATLFEVFRQARTAIENWVDDEKNRLRILHADLDEIKRGQAIQAIYKQYANYGKEMEEKLERHLEFMIENRRKYYKAVGQASSR